MNSFSQCRGLSWLLAVAAILGIAASLGGEEPVATRTTPDAAREIARLVAQLGAPSLAARQMAEEELLKLGVPALAALATAGDSDNIEIRLRATAVAGRINERRIAQAEVHVIGVYEAGSTDGKVVVRIDSAAKPVVLVVCAREAVQWDVRKSAEVELLKVIASGFHPQVVLGTNVPVQSLSTEGDHPPEVKDKAFYTYQSRGLRYDEMRERVKELTGKELSSFQGRYDGEGKPFVIGAKK